MSVSACPIVVIRAPVERVWRLLADPSRYAAWWEPPPTSIIPDGMAQTGQHIRAETTALGRAWTVRVTVVHVDVDHRQLDLVARLPFGITVHNHITCIAIDRDQTRVGFG